MPPPPSPPADPFPAASSPYGATALPSAPPPSPPTRGDATGEPEGDEELRPGSALARRRSTGATTQRWSRIAHVYVSMLALLVVLFFGFTGITLNHPTWAFGLAPTASDATGTLPASARAGSEQTRLLAVSEHLRQELHVRGNVTDFGYDGTQGTLAYRGPGYLADVTFDTTAGTYQAHVEQQGLIGVLNDLHKGRNADASWSWLIDLSGAFLVVIAVTGLVLQLVLRKRRRSAVVTATVAGLLVVVVAVLNLR